MTIDVSIDIGGTFTDLYLVSESGTRSLKVPTTSHDLSRGLLDVIEVAAAEEGASVEEFLARTTRLVHGTTIATNAIIEDDVGRTALLCTDGFRDVLWFREGGKSDPYDWDVDYPDPYVPRSLTYGVEERVTSEGDVLDPLDESQVRAVLEEIAEQDVDAVAVSLLWAHVNPIHEVRIGELIEEQLPGVPYSLSHDVNPVVREYRRTSSTVIDASLQSLVGEYLQKFQSLLAAQGFERSPLIVTANGGVMPVEEASRVPIWTVDSGPTMLPVAARHYATRERGRSNVIALDMGGTSFDVSVVSDGKIARTREATVGEDHVLGIEKTEVGSIGSGGGSIASVDAGGLVHVGPESAGAVPGPACYMRGGEKPTVTDAALVLGYLGEEHFLGGEMAISATAAERAIDRHVADPLDTDTLSAAYAVYATAVQDVTNGIKELTIEKGIDPREYVISGGGGALGMLVVPVARELQIDDVLLPENAGVVSAVGGLTSDLVRDFSMSTYTRSDEFDHEAVAETVAELGQNAHRFFERNGVGEDQREVTYYCEGRYPNQVWELEVRLPTEKIDLAVGGSTAGTDAATDDIGDESITDGIVDELEDRFHESHEHTYGFETGEPVEFLSWRVEARGRTERPVDHQECESRPGETREPHETRNASFGGGPIDTPAYDGGSLPPGTRLEGPTILDMSTTTIVVLPGSELEVTPAHNFHIHV